MKFSGINKLPPWNYVEEERCMMGIPCYFISTGEDSFCLLFICLVDS